MQAGHSLSRFLCAVILLFATISPAGSEQAPPVPQFKADPDFFKLPADFKWGQVIGIFADSRGHVWTSSSGRITEWDPQGKRVQSWDARGPDGKWSTIHGLFVDHNNFVWTNARESNLTVKFTRDGKVVLVIGKFDQTGGSNDTSLMGRPSEIWVDPADNEVFVADGYGNRRIIVFDGATGKYLRHWGAYGKRPEDPPQGAQGAQSDEDVPKAPPTQFRTPHGIVGSRDGLIYRIAPTTASRCSGRTASSCARRSCGPGVARRRRRRGRRSGRAATRRRSPSASHPIRSRPISTALTAARTSSLCCDEVIWKW
jgi:hypothetical protein